MCSVQPPTQPYTVQVGAHSQLLFNPSQIDAAIGDKIRFQFHELNHTVTQSSLQNPCLSIGGFDTGFTRFNPGGHLGSIVSYVVEKTDPQWFFGRQRKPRSHCPAGVVFAIDLGDKMNQFLDNARTQSTGTTSMLGNSRSDEPADRTREFRSSPIGSDERLYRSK